MNIRFSENTVRIRLEPDDEGQLSKTKRLAFALGNEWRCVVELNEHEELYFNKNQFHLTLREDDYRNWVDGRDWDWEQRIDGMVVHVEKDIKAYKKKKL